MKKLMLFGIPAILAVAGILFFAYNAHSFGFSHDSSHRASMMKDFVLFKIDRMAKELDLTADQQTRLDALKNNLETTFDERMQKRGTVREAVKKELQKENPDLTKLTPLIDEQIDGTAQNAHQVVNQVSEFLNSLNPHQKRILSDHLLEHLDEHDSEE